MAKLKNAVPRKRDIALDGHRGLHRKGSRKDKVHKTFDEAGPDAAQKLATELGLAEATYPNWRTTFQRQADTAAPVVKPARVAVNVSLDAALVAAAKELDVNVSRAAESGVAAEVMRLRGERWLEDNRAAIESSNVYVDRRGLPLEKFRMF